MIIIEFQEKTKIKSSHNAKEVNKFSSIGEFNYVQDLRTNLLQERERMMGSNVQRNKGASRSQFRI